MGTCKRQKEPMVSATNFPWFSALEISQQELIKLSYFLYQREAGLGGLGSASALAGRVNRGLYDYSFVVFPIAKAYEGFLKQYLYDLQLIDERTFVGRRFRIGRAMNPDIRESQQDEFWLYDDLELLCGKQTAHVLWQTWLQCRNRVVHFFPKEEHKITLSAAHERIEMVIETIDMAYQCKVDLDKQQYTAQ